MPEEDGSVNKADYTVHRAGTAPAHPEPSRLPRLSARMDVTSEFMLTPSCFARIATRA
jgi:hypothetical protein